MSELNEIFEIPLEIKDDVTIAKDDVKDDVTLAKDDVKDVKKKFKQRKVLSDERKLQLKEQLAKGRATALKNRPAFYRSIKTCCLGSVAGRVYFYFGAGEGTIWGWWQRFEGRGGNGFGRGEEKISSG